MHLRHAVRSLLTGAAALVLACAALAAPAHASSAPASAPASVLDVPPRGANDWSCKPDAAHPQPVVLVNGTFKLMAENWATLSPKLKRAGYCVFAFNYGKMATAPVPRSAAELKDFVEAVRAATGAAKVDLVGHSQGG
ncbi:alpha/beta fold hydrolase, partial [Streptomyces sp. SID337]